LVGGSGLPILPFCDVERRCLRPRFEPQPIEVEIAAKGAKDELRARNQAACRAPITALREHGRQIERNVRDVRVIRAVLRDEDREGPLESGLRSRKLTSCTRLEGALMQSACAIQ
jgi:hypothetical protein